MNAAPTQTPAPRFAALQHRNFTLLWAGLIVSNTGTWMQNVAQGWLVYQLTNSPFWLGMLALSFALPMTLLPLFGGAVIDRIPEKRQKSTRSRKCGNYWNVWGLDHEYHESQGLYGPN